MKRTLNETAASLLQGELPAGVAETKLDSGARLLDFGIESPGGLEAGLILARLCMADLATVSIDSQTLAGAAWPFVTVATDCPVDSCLLSQYAGWRISTDDYFAMASGPMRAAAAKEELFDKLNYSESASSVAGALEAGSLPTSDVVELIAEGCSVAPADVTLVIAPTSSLAGTLQVVARSVETAMHKLFELGFDVRRVRSGFGTAPLPPVAKDDLSGIGVTNDAILYGGAVTLWVTGDDESLIETGAHVPSSAADCFGKPFLQIFEEAGHDFYAIDPMLFSPARISFHNIETGRVHQFGEIRPDVLIKSFGL